MQLRGAAGAVLAAMVALAGACSAGERSPVANRVGPTGPRAAAASGSPTTLAAAGRSASPVDRLFGVGDAQQVIAVIADAPGDTTATLTAYERTATGWTEAFGPWTANLGAGGFAPPGEKREGDLRTPTGAFDLGFAFGVLPDPGVKGEYRRITSGSIVWDDDPASSRYNEWVDTSRQSAGIDPEPMYNQPVYNYGVVIAYNPERTPGLGSAIFLHVTKGGPTAGCVAIPQDDLVTLLRWLDPDRRPRIVMGTRDAVVP